MQYRSVKGFSGGGQLGFLFVFLGLGFILATAIQFFFIYKMMPAGASPLDKDALMKAMLAPENVTPARISQVLGTMALLFIPALLWSFVSNGKNMYWLGFSRYISFRQIVVGFLIIFTAGFAAAPLEDLSKMIVAHFPSLDATAKQLEAEYNREALALSSLHGWGDYIVALFIMAFFPAMFEEVFFRGALQNLLVRWLRKPIVGITITSVVFSLIHMSVYLFLSRFVLGFALGLMFYETKNIWINIFAHFINNTLALSQLFFSAKVVTGKDIDDLDPHVSPLIGIACFFALIGLFIFLRRYSAKNRLKISLLENRLFANVNPFGAIAKNTEQSGT